MSQILTVNLVDMQAPLRTLPPGQCYEVAHDPKLDFTLYNRMQYPYTDKRMSMTVPDMQLTKADMSYFYTAMCKTSTTR